MVYRGKPSAACGECRKRRSRCDQSIPACGQCRKAGRPCPGYRNTVDLMFHDESKQIARRNKTRSSDNDETQIIHAGSKQDALVRAVAAMPIRLTDFVLYQPMDELGVNFFMSTYVGDDPAVSQLYYLPKFYAKTGYSDPGLRRGIMAAGLAGYAKVTGNKDISDAATRCYSGAIRGINTAISDSKTVVQDSTLLSIIMAAMFEVLIVPRLTGMESCSNHLNGAVSVALMKLKQEGLTDISYRLFSTLVQSVIINCWVTHVPLPPRFPELMQHVQSRVISNSVHGNFLSIVMELVQFREMLQEETIKHPTIIIKQALTIDDMLERFAENMPPHGQFRAYHIATHDVEQLAYNGYYHVYPQRFTAHLWNNVRSSRLRLHQVVLRQCNLLLLSSLAGNYEFLKKQQAESKAKILEFAIEISATVPQLAGYVEQMAFHQPAEQTAPVRFSKAQSKPDPTELPYLAKPVGGAPVQHSSRSVYDQKSHLQSATPVRRPSEMSVFYSECNDNEFRADTPMRVHPPGPTQPASIYHILFQLYSLRSVSTLPSDFRAWMQGRIGWMEKSADPMDLARLQDLITKNPGDGFPVDDEGLDKIRIILDAPEATEPTTDDPNENGWLIAYNWCSVGWDRMGMKHFDTRKWSQPKQKRPRKQSSVQKLQANR